MSVVQRFVNGLGTASAVNVSAPGSPAWRLARHDLALNETFAANRRRVGPQSRRFVDGRVTVCPKGTTGGQSCSTLSNFATDASGHVTDLLVDGVPLFRRVARAMGPPVAITSPAGTVGLVGLESAYQASNGQFAIILDFASLANPAAGVLTLSEDAIRYQPTAGVLVMADSVLNERAPKNPTLSVKNPRNLLRVVLFFHGQTLGGQLTVTTVGNPPAPSLAGTAQLSIV